MEQGSLRFRGKTALVTGAAGGIGLATAKRLGAEGARVALVDLDPARIEAAAESTRSAGAPDVLPFAGDVSRSSTAADAVGATVRRLGQLDILVNNAGVMVFKPLEEHDEKDWAKVLGVDLLGAFFFTREAFRTMGRGGTIVNVSSIHAVETTPQVTSYAAAKAAVLSLTRSASIEGKAKGIRVNAVLPGAVDTPMLRENPNVKAGLEVIKKSDVGEPDDIAAVIAWLASPDSSFVTGASVRADGGRLAKL